jgi:hypothetical protein
MFLEIFRRLITVIRSPDLCVDDELHVDEEVERNNRENDLEVRCKMQDSENEAGTSANMNGLLTISSFTTGGSGRRPKPKNMEDFFLV